MAFFDRFKKWYMVRVRCYNCGFTEDCKVPKGLTIDAHLKTEGAMCSNCGNPTLRRIERVRVPEEMRTPVKEYLNQNKPSKNPMLPQLPPRPVQRPMRPQPPVRPQPARRPMPRPRPRPPQENYQEVDYPVNEPVYEEEQRQEPSDWNPSPKKINFWTGE